MAAMLLQEGLTGMKRLYVESDGTASWQARLADPSLHWKRQASAMELAVSWELAAPRPRGLPDAVERVLDTHNTQPPAGLAFSSECRNTWSHCSAEAAPRRPICGPFCESTKAGSPLPLKAKRESPSDPLLRSGCGNRHQESERESPHSARRSVCSSQSRSRRSGINCCIALRLPSWRRPESARIRPCCSSRTSMRTARHGPTLNRLSTCSGPRRVAAESARRVAQASSDCYSRGWIHASRLTLNSLRLSRGVVERADRSEPVAPWPLGAQVR